jgi:hypothetical protein
MTSNAQLDLAFEYVLYTNRNIFLTGKAGTGKTTFLHRIKAESVKRMVVTAPTGVAAINAGGMTLHSFFQLPFGMHVPGASRDEENRRRFTRQKIDLIRSLDLLIIDEVSMVRADLLDAVDEVLRRYRESSEPFGGAQLLMIGDLHQLPPVVKNEDWELLRPHYDTPYFFSSLALRKTEPVNIELQYIFRQSDERFIELLNKVRNNDLDATVLETLNSRYIRDFEPDDGDEYITLTSHNASAADINAQRLEVIAQRSRVFRATIQGEFPESAYPTEAVLEFKKGAQVMFVRNDLAAEKRYFNGKIGRIVRFGSNEIVVRCNDGEPIAVEPVEWQNIRYSLDESTKEIKEEQLGAFTQYPLKLAWAITIHKSQGLTFDRAIIDARSAFAHGQVYVALSRCRSFEGIVLSSRISLSSVKTDKVVRQFSEGIERDVPDEARLRQSKHGYQAAMARDLFDFKVMRGRFDQLNHLFRERPAALSPDGLVHFQALALKARMEIVDVADKFLPRLQSYLSQAELPDENGALLQRLKKAGEYFSSKLMVELLPALEKLHLVTDDKAVLKSAREHLSKLRKEIATKNACFMACLDGFSAQGHVRAKTEADLTFTAPKVGADEAAEKAPQNVPHPVLYARLQRWRADMSDALGMEPREVLPTRSLEEIVRLLPTNRKALKQVTGIGAGKLQRFQTLIALVREYVDGNRVPTPAVAVSVPPPPGSTKLISYELYKSGKSVGEIAAERGLATVTIETHLAYFIGSGNLDILAFLTEKQVEETRHFFTDNNTESTAEAKAHFGDRYSYGQLRMVLEHMKGKRPPAQK